MFKSTKTIIQELQTEINEKNKQIGNLETELKKLKEETSKFAQTIVSMEAREKSDKEELISYRKIEEIQRKAFIRKGS